MRQRVGRCGHGQLRDRSVRPARRLSFLSWHAARRAGVARHAAAGWAGPSGSARDGRATPSWAGPAMQEAVPGAVHVTSDRT